MLAPGALSDPKAKGKDVHAKEGPRDVHNQGDGGVTPGTERCWDDLREALLHGPYGQLRCLLACGSIGPDAIDKDYVAVYEGLPSSGHFLVGRLDMIVIDITVLKDLAEVLDPVATEPILTGRLAYGDANFRDSLRGWTLNLGPTGEAVDYLRSKHWESLENTFEIFRSSPTEYPAIRLCASNLLYAIGYFVLASAYSLLRCRATTIQQAVTQADDTVKALWDRGLKLKRGHGSSRDISSYRNDVRAWAGLS